MCADTQTRAPATERATAATVADLLTEPWGVNQMGGLSIRHWLIVIVWIGVFIVPAWKIVAKAGYPGALSLLLIVPLLNIVLVWLFAFSNWPAQRRA
jgi:hypothetical protein